MKLIPQPRQLELQSGSYRVRYQDRITLDTSCGEAAYDYGRLVARELERQTGFSLCLDRRTSRFHSGIHLFLSGEVKARLGTESYELRITERGVELTGGDDAGLLYGVQTLRQIIRQSGPLLPCLSIADAPALPARGLFYDVTRGRIPTMDFLKRLADRCSFYKINQLHLYMEHTFLFDGLSEVWRDDTPLTAAEILELDGYCRKLHVELVPSIATLGHLYKVLRTRTYHHLSELEEAPGAGFSFYNRMAHHTLNVTDEASLELVFRMIDEFLPLFSSPLFNINGDEPFDLGRGRGAALAAEVGTHRMYVDWIRKVCEHVKARGKRPMFWGDIILAHPETLRELPEDVICMNWDYAPEPREESARKLRENGATQYLCPGAQGWKQTINRIDLAYANIRTMAEYARKYEAAGLLVTEWGDFGHLQDPESSTIGILYGAAMGWDRRIPDEEQLNAAVSVLEYGDKTGGLLAVLRRLCRQTVMNWGEAVEFVEISRGRIVDKSLAQLWKDYLPRIEPLLSRAGEVNAEIDRCQDELCALMRDMNPASRARLLPYFVMSDGQKLLNRLMVVLESRCLGHQNALDVDPKTLATEMEWWYDSYKKLWRTSSRESELYRIGEIIFWLADFLREQI